MTLRYFLSFLFTVVVCHSSYSQTHQLEWQPELTESWYPVPEMVFKGADRDIPSDAIVLFDGSHLEYWEPANWHIQDGILTVVPGVGGITTKDAFGDVQLHIEWRIPEDVNGESQGRGNSGIFLQGLYEVQILDSYTNATYTNGQAGAIYKQYPPQVNASFPSGEWQTYDIYFEAPVFRKDGKLLKPAYMTVLHNGIFVQNHVEIKGPTIYTGLPVYEPHAEEMPLTIQGSRHDIAFRNIWIRRI